MTVALQRGDQKMVEHYKKEIFRVKKRFCFPRLIGQIHERLQFVAPRQYFSLMLEIIDKMDFKLLARVPEKQEVLDSVPIYLAAMGCHMQTYEPEFFDAFLQTSKFSLV